MSTKRSIWQYFTKQVFRHMTFGLFLFAFSFAFSQTVYDAPKLNCVKNAGSFIELYWDIPASRPCFQAYEIYYALDNRNGPYTLLQSITDPLQNNISINLSLADSAFFYLVHRGSCVNPGSPNPATSDTLDNIKPQPFTELVNVTVVSGQVNVNWVPAKSPEVVSYLVYSDADGFNKPDTVVGRFNTNFVDPLANPNTGTHRYKVRALEYCEDPAGLQGAITPDSADHASVLLSTIKPDACSQSVFISWKGYKYRNSSVRGYEIEMSVNGGPFTNAGLARATDTSFTIPDIPARVTICIRLKALLPNAAAAYSNEQCFISDVLQAPKYDYIRNITVDGNNIVVDYVIDTAASRYRNIILQRSPDGLLFNLLTLQPPTPLNTYSVQFTDGSAKPAERPFYYRVQLNDSCSNLHFSDTATALYLNVKEKTGNRADIQWRGFAIDQADFQQFRLEKFIGNDTTLLGTFNRGDQAFLMDDLFDYTADTLEDVCFRITAEFYNLNDAAPQELLYSYSNIVCLAPKPKFFMPNAFAPDGFNKTIKPILLLARPDGYRFTIFNRWHQTMFSTSDINAAWEGMYKGSPAPFDSYIFLVEFTGKDGQTYSETGTIMLIR